MVGVGPARITIGYEAFFDSVFELADVHVEVGFRLGLGLGLGLGFGLADMHVEL